MSKRRSALEFALVAPMLVVLLCGILAYGGYFWLAHSVQQLANDSARAALAGLDAGERAQIARASVDGQATSYPMLNPTLLAVNIDDTGPRLAVAVAYDAAASPFFVFKSLFPMPSSTIRRQAAVRLGGY